MTNQNKTRAPLGIAITLAFACSAAWGLDESADRQFRAQLNSIQEDVRAGAEASRTSTLERFRGIFSRASSGRRKSAPPGVGQDGLEGQVAKTDLSLRDNPNVVVNRRLANYQGLLDGAFRADLLGLRPDQRWIDVGAGGALACVDYLNGSGKAQVTAVTITAAKSAELDEALAAFGPARFRYLAGKHIEDYGAEGLGQADLITDVYGAVAYSPHIDETIAKLAGLLKVGGRIYTHLTNDSAPSLRIEGPRGEKIRDYEWLGSIEGMRLRHADGFNLETIVLEKISENVRVPQLQLVKYDEHYPPHRLYRWPEGARR